MTKLQNEWWFCDNGIIRLKKSKYSLCVSELTNKRMNDDPVWLLWQQDQWQLIKWSAPELCSSPPSVPARETFCPAGGERNQINKFSSKMAWTMMIVTGKASPARRSFLIAERRRVVPWQSELLQRFNGKYKKTQRRKTSWAQIAASDCIRLVSPT